MNAERKLKILLFGATRNTGYYVMKQALEAGHEVTALIRNPAAFDYTHSNLKVVKGDALDLSTFETEIQGKDVIISSLGITPSDFNKPAVICSQGTKNMISGMKKYQIKRIICVSASALDTNPKMGFLIRFAAKILQRVLKHSYADLKLMETELKSSGLEWTIVRPPKLNDKPAKGTYRVAIGEHLSWPMNINRADLADCICRHITDPSTYQKTLEIAY